MRIHNKKSPDRVWFMAAAMIILGAMFALYTKFMLWGQWTYDEGFYFVTVRLMDNGHTPYHDLHMSEQPLMVWNAYLPHLLWDSIWGMRFIMVGYAVLGLATLIALGRLLSGRLTGLLAALFLAAHYEFFEHARRVNPETTSVTLALVSLLLVLYYRLSGKRYLLILSAVALAGSFLLKLFMVIALPLGILILAFYPTGQNPLAHARQNKKRIFTDYLLWFGITFGLVFAVWLMMGLPNLIQQSILFYINRNAAYVYNPLQNLTTIWKLIAATPIFSAVALLGLGVALAQFKRSGWIIATWALLTLLFLMTFTPLRSKHLRMLLPLVALLAAVGFNQLVVYWWKIKRNHSLLNWGGGAILALLTISLSIEMVAPFNRLTYKPVKPLLENDVKPIAQGILKFTTPQDCLITDDPYMAYVTKRLPPPWFSNMSYARFTSGSLKMEELQAVTNQANCQVVVPTFDRLKNGSRPFYNWLKLNYLRIWVVEGYTVMLGKPLYNINPDMPLQANFNNQVELLGADWTKADAGTVYLTLYWKGLQKFEQRYKIFVHLRNPANQTIATGDHEVYDGLLPTQLWPLGGGILKDTNRLPVSEIPPGTYTLYIGLYNPDTLERLPLVNDTSGENAAIIPNIVIK